MSLRIVLLGLLTSEPNTGYGLGRLLRGEMNHLREASLQQIYTELSWLSKEGLVDVEVIPWRNGPAKKVYTITSEGKEKIGEWLAEPPTRAPRDDLLVHLYLLDWAGVGVLIRHVQERLAESERKAQALRTWLSAPARLERNGLGPVLAAEAALVRSEAEGAWCRAVLARLQDAPEQ